MAGLQRERFGDFSVLRRPATHEPSLALHFAHATGFNAESYRPLYSILDPSLDVHAMDARGHGFSEAPANPRKLRSWRPFVRDLESFVEKLGRPALLAGHSMGATVSMELAAVRPDLVQGLVMIDPVIPPPAFVPLLAVARFFGQSGRLIPIAGAAAKRRTEFPSKEAAVDNYVGKGPFRTWEREWIEAYVDGGTAPTPHGVRLTCDRDWESRVFAFATVDPYRALRKVRCPITLVTREHDGPPFTHASRFAFMKCQPGTRLLVLDDATHFLAMERPEVVQEEIERMASELR